MIEAPPPHPINLSRIDASFIVVLVGLPGAGKSTFARDMERLSNRVTTVCQDVLKSRAKCEKFVRGVLANDASPQVVIVDRTNISREQRSHWYGIAEDHDKRVDIVYFKRQAEDCFRRCDERLEEGKEGHPTLTKKGSGKRIVNMMKNKITQPTEIESPSIRNIFVSETDKETAEVLRFYVGDGGGEEERKEVFDLTGEEEEDVEVVEVVEGNKRRRVEE